MSLNGFIHALIKCGSMRSPSIKCGDQLRPFTPCMFSHFFIHRQGHNCDVFYVTLSVYPHRAG
jgi:hypothetical protein